jgi:hypothetical protein
MQTTKLVRDGYIYAQTVYGDGTVVVEKSDPRIVHNAPASVVSGSQPTVTFSVVDFDGEPRTDVNGSLLLDLDGTPLTLPIVQGAATLPLQLFASLTIKQQPPYTSDARLQPFVIEVDD